MTGQSWHLILSHLLILGVLLVFCLPLLTVHTKYFLFDNEARWISLFLLSTHDDFLRVSKHFITFSNLRVNEIILSDLLVQMIRMVLSTWVSPDSLHFWPWAPLRVERRASYIAVMSVLVNLFDRKDYRLRIYYTGAYRLWWLACCPNKAQLFYLIDFVNILPYWHFRSCLLVIFAILA